MGGVSGNFEIMLAKKYGTTKIAKTSSEKQMLGSTSRPERSFRENTGLV